jgi:valyl-tRNA synthetase
LRSGQAKLENPSFRDKAPPEVVHQQSELVADLQSQIKAIEENLRDLRQS